MRPAMPLLKTVAMLIPMTGKRYLVTEGRSCLILTKHFNKNILTV